MTNKKIEMDKVGLPYNTGWIRPHAKHISNTIHRNVDYNFIIEPRFYSVGLTIMRELKSDLSENYGK